LKIFAVDFAYVALLKYPDFIDHVCESQLNTEKFGADGLLDSILHLKNMKSPPEHQRRKGETTQAWMTVWKG